MNLIEDPWMPVRRTDGTREWITPERLSDPDIVAFDADRADFNGALMQFSIGLLQTTTPIESPTAWRSLLSAPPDAQSLRAWFAPVSDAFELYGDGPRFMQDLTILADSPEIYPVSALLIDSPADNTVKLNKDHFVKRGQMDELCPVCAATALFTLQTNAPGGGPGYRTSVRGGGPLTTILVSNSPKQLWHNLWLNILHRPLHLGHNGRTTNLDRHHRFPWTADFRVLQRDKQWEINPEQTHPDHVFWATPRRIRLDLENIAEGLCDLCGRESDTLIRKIAAKNYGLNYKGAWDHPQSPYYEDKGTWRALHPQSDGMGYRHWLAWVLGADEGKNKQRPARVVSHALEERRRQLGGALRLWAFGYDMDNMKARCWYESSLPLYGLGECASKQALSTVSSSVATWLAGAQQAAFCLRSAVKDAWFGGDARGDFSAVDAEFWHRTEAAFYVQLRQCIEAVRQDETSDPDTLESRQAWHRTLVVAALTLFDHTFVGTGPIERQKPRRIAEAHRQLVNSLHGKKMREALRLPAPEKPAAGRGKSVPAEA
ncbi:MAG: type I-E CRISPR-associated protein Cse1/CasA [Rhodocyclaceae bacterium]|nr:MAG: type I-E CRISPR-associated protein Cse1/CasA [Pseudomonadota bacterium]